MGRGSVGMRVDLTCQGLHAALLDVPAVLTPAWASALRQLNLTQAKSIEECPPGWPPWRGMTDA
jgi:hypothetical protein